jgi:hypothetical protein
MRLIARVFISIVTSTILSCGTVTAKNDNSLKTKYVNELPTEIMIRSYKKKRLNMTTLDKIIKIRVFSRLKNGRMEDCIIVLSLLKNKTLFCKKR